jgi:type I restriction enzyme S subunit
MNVETFLANFGHLAEAPNGIPKLRELILQLAVRGKLVPQDSNDEPASELLKKIQVEKQHLIAEGLIRKRKPLPSIKPEERLQELPAGWEWVRLGEVGIMSPRNTASDNEIVGFVPMSLVSDTFGSYPQNEERPWGEIKKGYTHFANGDVVLAKITPCFENGKSGVIRGLPNGFGAGTTELHVIRPIRDEVGPEYIWVFFKSPRFREAGEDQMTGTAGQKRVPRAYVESSLLPLPPLAEQKRIVAKVDELMALCDDFEAKLQQSQTDAENLLTAIVHKLTAT